MKIYHHDDLPGDPRLPHSSTSTSTSTSTLTYLPPSTLDTLGILHFHFPPSSPTSAPFLDRLATAQSYVSRDTITISPAALGDTYDSKIAKFYEEHMHEDEEVRYVLGGRGFFDVRDKGDQWVRIEVVEGDLLVLPAGIYHRFTVDEGNYLKALRLFQTEPKWIALQRNEDTDKTASRKEYMERNKENEFDGVGE